MRRRGNGTVYMIEITLWVLSKHWVSFISMDTLQILDEMRRPHQYNWIRLYSLLRGISYTDKNTLEAHI